MQVLPASLLAAILTAVASAAHAQAPPAGEPPEKTPPPAPSGDAAAPEPEESGPDAAATPGAGMEPKPDEPPPPEAGFGTAASAAAGVSWPDPARDTDALRRQGNERPESDGAPEDRVYAEDWWSHARPALELHGYFRVRAELFQNFSLGRVDHPEDALWPMPFDNRYLGREHADFGPSIARCTPDEAGNVDSSNDDPNLARLPCKNKTQAGANLRFRLRPEIHISDNLRIQSEIDLLDNLVLGSTPSGRTNHPAATGGGYATRRPSAYAPVGVLDETQVAPSAGVNSLTDSIEVKRAWAEYTAPIGTLRFGRMPAHWGLGILQNSGDGYDSDYQTTIDRIQFITGMKALDLYFAGSWDFPAEGATSESLENTEGQPYDLGQLDDVDQYSFAVFRRKNRELARRALADGTPLLNGGAYLIHRKQLLANDTVGECSLGAAALDCAPGAASAGLSRRGASFWIPDVWLQLLYKKFRFEMELVTVQGTLENTSNVESNYADAPGGEGWTFSEWGLATEIQQKLVEERLSLDFGFGWASGDPDVDGLAPDPKEGLERQQKGDDTFSTFRFHPDYRLDLIFYRNILTRVQGTYYFRPSISYDFIRDPNGQRLGGSFAGIWSRASEFIQAPGHERDLAIELDVSLFYQSKDGALNDDSARAGGFFTMLQYGVLFPLGGLGFQRLESVALEEIAPGASETSAAHVLRWYLGALF